MGNQPSRQNREKREEKGADIKPYRDQRNRRNSSYVTSVQSDVREKYKIDPRELGHGHYGVVRRCQNRETGQWYAIKTIRKSKVGRIESLKREIEILGAVDHPNIIRLIDVYEEEKYLHLVTELCSGGELFDRIISKTQSDEGHYSEKDASIIISKILQAIDYCHTEHNICHRDLKPENFLFETPDDDSELKIIDFGLSRFEDDGQAMSTRVGTPYYIAPEVLSRNYDKACDLWSIGVIMYILLCGFPPFYGDSDADIFAAVRRGEFNFPSPEWDNITDEAKDLIRQLLRKNPADRPTAAGALTHQWFSRVNEGGLGQLITSNIQNSLRRFMGMNRLKKIALGVIAEQLTENEIGHLRRVFESIDADGNGHITVDELHAAMQSEGLDLIEEEVLRLMEGLDIDGSNTLDYQEFLAATMEVNVFIREENIRRAFHHFDVDGTGFITFANLCELMGSEEHAREVVGAVDENGDGVISYEEFRAMMQETGQFATKKFK